MKFFRKLKRAQPRRPRHLRPVDALKYVTAAEARAELYSFKVKGLNMPRVARGHRHDREKK